MNASVLNSPNLTPSQNQQRLQGQAYLENFIETYNQRTKTSKGLAQRHRAVLADRRNSEGFHPAFKEMVYPIVGKQALGSRLTDVDGNEYIDLVMGFGVSFFGHNPPFIKDAIAQRLEQGFHIGPQSDLAGEVAEMISELTGLERVTFSNTGTEAVMTALRLARAATGRSKIVMFSGSYHGHFDGTLAQSQIIDGILRTIPSASGVPENITKDVLVLEYGNPQSLEIISHHSLELAAVIVEPIQDEQPNLQPHAFLKQLRQLTQEAGIALIFDEMLTGFRIHLGGAQAWFGIQADIATYGKIIGGGMPIGVIAGSSTYMDKIDGGDWNYGDASSPQTEKTFFAGTYCKHPLAMAAAHAVLQYLKQQGPSLQERLNQRTQQFIETLNAYFNAEGLPLQLANFGSVFNAVSSGVNDPIAQTNDDHSTAASMNLLCYHLIHKGVFIQGSGGILSTAHTDEDLEQVIHAIQQSVKDLQEAAILP
ncbi:MAG: aspartate aminotransferase family protein [Acaryochloris sp. RU_4_1]|nr:aspartate aminotransferase family protein [Acaryochloris sp. RU_4_1]NJR53721.1 aspartate aminotransferase family protein [Acaryochloris sp. CRU_2_0]